MDQTNKKVITVSFLFAGIVLTYTLNTILQLLEATVSTFARLADNDIITHGIPIAAGLIFFLLLQFSPRAVRWGDEVVSEIRKMVWTPTKDITAVTIAVCIMVILSGLLLGVLDLISSKVINYLISL
jgi:preprotein translocase subunit SecE